MKAAIVHGRGQTPVYGDFPEPVAQAGEVMLHVMAAALSPLTKTRASGSHYSSSGQYPAVAGVDGVGRTQDGRRLYFVSPRAPFGGMAEQVAVRMEQCIPLPDGLDDVMAAAIANPGMSSCAALRERARLVPGERVLVNGATGTAGRLAVQMAKHMGAKKVVATGRDEKALEELKTLGADGTISLLLPDDELEAAFKEQFAGDGIDIVLDYLWGKSAATLIVAAAKAAKDETPMRFVQIGSVSGNEISLPAAALRSSGLVLMGSGLGSVSTRGLLSAIAVVMQAAAAGKLQIKTETIPLAEVEKNWNKDSGQARVVFVL